MLELLLVTHIICELINIVGNSNTKVKFIHKNDCRLRTVCYVDTCPKYKTRISTLF